MLFHWSNNDQRREMDYVHQLRKEKRLATAQRLRETAKSEQIWNAIFFCIFWDSDGVPFYELPQKGEFVTSDVYCRQLMKVAEKNSSFYGWTTKRCSPIFLHDNARPHTSNQTKKCLSELNFEVLLHPLRHGANRFSLISDLVEFSGGKNAQWYRGGKKVPQWLFCVKTLGFV